jgi:hypothetical protein
MTGNLESNVFAPAKENASIEKKTLPCFHINPA